MQPQAIVLVFSLLGITSCALAVGRAGRASLLLASAASAVLAALGAESGNAAGMEACAVLAVGNLACSLIAGPWADASPLAPLTIITAMGLYLRGSSFAGVTEELLLLLGAALALSRIVSRELAGDAAQIGSTAIALGILALGLASKTGYTSLWLWGLDSSLLACPLLAAAISGLFSTRSDESRDVALSLCVGAALLVHFASTAELCVLLAVAGALHVMNSRRRRQALLDFSVGTAVVALLGVNLMDQRFSAWLRAPKDVYGVGFDLNVFIDTLNAAHLFGDGTADPITMLTTDSSSVYVLGQVVSAFGWAGLVLALLCVASVAIVSLRALPALAPAEKNLTLALLVTLGVFATGNVTYVFHLLPVPAMPFPLLSPGTSPMLTFALLGVTLSRLTGSAKAPRSFRGTLVVRAHPPK